MAGQSIRIQPDEFTKEQHHRIGITTPDSWGRIWTYCMFPGGTTDVTRQVGKVFRDSIAADLLSAAVGTVSTIADIGTNVLTDTGEFSGDDLRGAVGQIVSSDGEGQVFQVLGHKQDDRANSLIISLISNAAGATPNGRTPGWEVALALTSTYRLSLPGRALQSVAASLGIRGVLQSELVLPANETLHGWLLQRGPGFFRLDVDGAAIANPGDPIRVAAGGLVRGGTAGAQVGRATLGDLGGSTTDGVIYGVADIVNDDVSLRNTIKGEPYNRDDNGDLIL